MKIYFETEINAPLEEVKKSFNQELFTKLSPKSLNLEIERFDGCKKGDEIHLALKLMKLRQKWVSVVTDEQTAENSWSFTDEGKSLPWPLTFWKHTHKVVKVSSHKSRIVDDINFECRPEQLAAVVYPALYLIFAVRPSRYKKHF